MEVDVYADLLFLINAAMDGLCLSLTARILHRRVSPWRILLGSVLGGLYAVAALFPDVGTLLSLTADLLVCFLLCAVTFATPRQRGRSLLRLTLLYLLLSLILGGVMTALFTLFNRLGIADILSRLSGGKQGEGAEGWIFGLVAALGGILTLWGGRFLGGSTLSGGCRVEVDIAGTRIVLEGLIDTGNLLRDPMSGRPVICADESSLASILPSAAWDRDRGGLEPSRLPPSLARRLRIIPTRTATGEGLLYGLLPDRVSLDKGGGGVDVEAVIAITKLTGTEAIVPAELCR